MERLLDHLQQHPYLAGLAVLMAVAVAVYELRQRSQDGGSVTPQQAVLLMNRGGVVFDVRGKAAHAEGHIRNSRPLDEADIDAAGETQKKYKAKNVVVYCDSGVRSARAVRKLREQGFEQVFNLKGGLAAWRADNLPVHRG
jgi:rhodanese-related sulfurtransferase